MPERDVVPLDEADDVLSTTEGDVIELSPAFDRDLKNLLALADSADRRVKAIDTVLKASIGNTNVHDWIDQNGVPYLSCAGAEKIRVLWGLKVQIKEKTRIERDDYYMWIVTLHIKGPYVGEIEAIGTRRSNDPFFAKRGGEIIPMNQVDEASVLKAAYTNALVNGITRLLGLRNLTWEDLQRYGIQQSAVDKVERFKKTTATDEEKKKQEEVRNTLIELCGGDARAALLKLKEITAFVAKDGTEVPGVSSFSSLRGKRLDIALGKVRKLKAEAEAAMEQEAEETDTEQPEDGEPVSDTLIEG